MQCYKIVGFSHKNRKLGLFWLRSGAQMNDCCKEVVGKPIFREREEFGGFERGEPRILTTRYSSPVDSVEIEWWKKIIAHVRPSSICEREKFRGLMLAPSMSYSALVCG